MTIENNVANDTTNENVIIDAAQSETTYTLKQVEKMVNKQVAQAKKVWQSDFIETHSCVQIMVLKVNAAKKALASAKSDFEKTNATIELLRTQANYVYVKNVSLGKMPRGKANKTAKLGDIELDANALISEANKLYKTLPIDLSTLTIDELKALAAKFVKVA